MAQVQCGQLDPAILLHNFRAAVYNRIHDFSGSQSSSSPRIKPLDLALRFRTEPVGRVCTGEVGECPLDEYLPTMTFGILQMTYEEINRLSMAMNDTFGIDEQDELDSSQFKVLEWARTL